MCTSAFFFFEQLKIIKDNGLAKRTQLLHKICESLQPKFYNEHCYIVKEGDPIDAVFLITEGIVWTCTSIRTREIAIQGCNSCTTNLALLFEEQRIRDDFDKDNGNGVVLNPICQVHRIT